MQRSPEMRITSEDQSETDFRTYYAEATRRGRCQAVPAEVLWDSRPNSQDDEDTKLPAKPISSMDDACGAQHAQVMDSLSLARHPEHNTAASTDPKVAAATSDATTVTGDQDRQYATAATTEMHTLIGTATPPKCSFDPPALITPETEPETAMVTPSVSAVQAMTNARGQSHQNAAGQHGEPVDVKLDEELHGSNCPRTTRQVACAARTILSLSRGDGASTDTVPPCPDRATAQRSCRATNNGVMPAQAPAEAKNISSLAALLAGDMAGQKASMRAPSVAVAVTPGHQHNTSGSQPIVCQEHNERVGSATAVRGAHTAATRSWHNGEPMRNGEFQPAAGRKRRTGSLVQAEDRPERERPDTFSAAQPRETSRAARQRDSCAGEQRGNEGGFHRSAGAGAASGAVITTMSLTDREILNLWDDFSASRWKSLSDMPITVPPGMGHKAPLGYQVSHEAPARLRRSRSTYVGPNSTAPDDATVDRSHCHGSLRPQRDEQRNGVMTGEALAPRPLRSHPHAVPRAASRRRPSSLQHSSHRDGLQDSQVNAFDRKPEHGSSNKRCHPDSAAPDDCCVNVGDRHGGQASMCPAGLEWPAVGAMHSALHGEDCDPGREGLAAGGNGLHEREMDEVDAGSGDGPHRKVGKSSRSEKYQQFSNLKGVLVYSKEMFHKCSQVVTGLKHELLEKETEVSLLTSEVESLRSVVRLAQDMFKIIDECDSTNYRGQFDSNVANCLGR